MALGLPENVALTKLDCLDDLEEIPVCLGYRLDGKPVSALPALAEDIARLEPEYERFPGWKAVTTGATRWLGASRPAALDGIDGLYFVDATTLLAVQNGTSPARVSRLHLDSGRTRVEAVDVVEQASSWLGAPTHGVVVGDRFYFIAKSGWEHMNDDGTVKPQESPRGSLILSAPAK